MNYSEFKEKYTITLNEQQEKAVQATEGAVLLLAVPGSGKTTVLVNRLGYMTIAKGIRPESILTMTYTVAATKDMRARFEALFGKTDLEFRTINGVCSKIINYYADTYERNAFDLVTKENELSAIISSTFHSIAEQDDVLESKFLTDSEKAAYKTAISYAKNMMFSEDEIKEMNYDLPHFDEVFRLYNEQLAKERKMDYDDQLVIAYKILNSKPDILAHYQNTYKYICVDEAQDTSKIQHKIIELLAKKSGNIFMVGDEDQSIYGFRAAYPQALLDFEKTYRNTTVLLLETNYRSSKRIIGIANDFIEKNKNRHKKRIIPIHQSGVDVVLKTTATRMTQYSDLLMELSEEENQYAVLFRNNESAIALISLIDEKQLPINYYYRGNDASFFASRYVIDIVNILKFASNPADIEAFQSVYYKLFFRMSKQAMLDICKKCKKEDKYIFDVIDESSDVSVITKKRVKKLKDRFLAIANKNIRGAIDDILFDFGYIEHIEGFNGDAVKSILATKMDTLKIIGNNDNSAAEFIAHLDRLKRLVEEGNRNNDADIIFSTVHSSKGLEYEKVSIVDLAEYVFPSVDEQDEEQFEEERRLFYVAMTRAKQLLTVYDLKSAECPFAKEIGKYISARKRSEQEAKKREALKHLSKEFKAGNKIYHKRFGLGTIKDVYGNMITVHFEKRGEKKLSINYLVENNLLEYE